MRAGGSAGGPAPAAAAPQRHDKSVASSRRARGPGLERSAGAGQGSLQPLHVTGVERHQNGRPRREELVKRAMRSLGALRDIRHREPLKPPFHDQRFSSIQQGLLAVTAALLERRQGETFVGFSHDRSGFSRPGLANATLSSYLR